MICGSHRKLEHAVKFWSADLSDGVCSKQSLCVALCLGPGAVTTLFHLKMLYQLQTHHWYKLCSQEMHNQEMKKTYQPSKALCGLTETEVGQQITEHVHCHSMGCASGVGIKCSVLICLSPDLSPRTEFQVL